jgi:hypothetical protein
MILSLVVSQVVSWLVIAGLVVVAGAGAPGGGLAHAGGAGGRVDHGGWSRCRFGQPVIEANDINGRHVHIGGPAKTSRCAY